MSSTLGVTGATTLSSTLDVTGATTLNSSVTMLGGSVTIGNSTANQSLTIYGTESITSTLSVTGAATFSSTVGITGQCTAASFNANSDYRIKENVKDLNDNFTIDVIRPVEYNIKNSNEKAIGVIAHELQEIYPFLVNGQKDGEILQSVNYIGLIPILINEIKILKKEIKVIKTKLEGNA